MRASEYDYSHPTHRAAREDAFARSDGICQSCGLEYAEHGHHWEWIYPPPELMTGDRLTALCERCHSLATRERRRKFNAWLNDLEREWRDSLKDYQ